MPSRPHAPIVVVLLLFILSSGGCTMWLAKPPIDSEWRVHMPSEVVAAILSGALVIELHAEPIAIACGAPVQPTGDGAYRIELTGNAHGQWLPIASHRMIVRGDRERAQVELIDLADAKLPGFVWQRHHTVRIDVQPIQHARNSQQGSLVRLLASKGDHQRLTPLIERTLSLAASVNGSGPGLAEPNLSAWRLSQLLLAAKETTDRSERGNLLRRAARQPTAPSSVFRDLAQLAASNGQLDQAITCVHHALFCEPNPSVRGRLAMLAEEYRQRSIGPTDLRTRALSLLATGDVSGATKMLHSARRTDPKPALDYQLLAHVHRQRGDQLAALAAQLLAREYDAQTQPAGDAAAIARSRGLSDFARRLSTDIKAASTSVQSIAPNAQRATPPRE